MKKKRENNCRDKSGVKSEGENWKTVIEKTIIAQQTERLLCAKHYAKSFECEECFYREENNDT